VGLRAGNIDVGRGDSGGFGMTTITSEQSLLEQALNALLLPCDRWNKQQFLIVKGAIESLNAALAAPATAPAWNNVPTCEGLWLCDEGDENPYRFTCHDISMPLNPHLVGEGERWYGPIPENTQ